MRSIGPYESEILQARHSKVYLRVEIKNLAGAYVDYSDYFSGDWLEHAEITKDVDQRIAQATISVVREIRHPASDSIGYGEDANLRSVSPLLSSDIDVGREFRISAARVTPDAIVTDADYKPLIIGFIDRWETHDNPMTLTGRDLLGRTLMDRWIKQDTIYGDNYGVPIEVVGQQIIDEWAAGIHTIVLDPAAGLNTYPFLITPAYTQQPNTIWEALQALFQLIGYVLEYRWEDDFDAFVLRLSEPAREPDLSTAVPMWTFGPDDYYDVTQLSLEVADIRNVVKVSFVRPDPSYPDDPIEDSITVQDPLSVAKYGERWMELQEGTGSPIDTAEEANNFGRAALHDTSYPVADHEIETDFFWPVELEDILRFLPNDVHYVVQQTFAVARWTHVFEKGTGTTKILGRGRVVGAPMNWRRRARRGGGGGGGGGGMGEGSPADWSWQAPSVNEIILGFWILSKSRNPRPRPGFIIMFIGLDGLPRLRFGGGRTLIFAFEPEPDYGSYSPAMDFFGTAGNNDFEAPDSYVGRGEPSPPVSMAALVAGVQTTMGYADQGEFDTYVAGYDQLFMQLLGWPDIDGTNLGWSFMTRIALCFNTDAAPSVPTSGTLRIVPGDAGSGPPQDFLNGGATRIVLCVYNRSDGFSKIPWDGPEFQDIQSDAAFPASDFRPLISDFVAGTPVEFPLNVTGLAHINLDGPTWFAIRWENDLDASEPGMSLVPPNSPNAQFELHSADAVTEDLRPRLRLEFA